jgi:hypothetical protein
MVYNFTFRRLRRIVSWFQALLECTLVGSFSVLCRVHLQFAGYEHLLIVNLETKLKGWKDYDIK